MDVEITDDSLPEDIDRHTRLMMMLMFGGVLFPNTSGNLVSLRFLHHLEQLDDLPGYNLGAAILGYLYRQICRACMGTQRDVAEFLPMLQFQPPLPPIAPDAPPPPFLPLAWRWVDKRGYGREVEA
uniref:Aminotransferase-like plant mobile domain-containing protein n=1 Tax=Nicotiana tabacum TaxID=4097 RepID=A0A1S3ZT17_TOBAC|nr:PREDICTED: uncharacterized protein LOC107790167 [Nicotiana tabacum]